MGYGTAIQGRGVFSDDGRGLRAVDNRYLRGWDYLLNEGTEYQKRTVVLGVDRMFPESKVIVREVVEKDGTPSVSGRHYSVAAQLVKRQLEARGKRISLVQTYTALPFMQREVLRAIAWDPISELTADYCNRHGLGWDEERAEDAELDEESGPAEALRGLLNQSVSRGLLTRDAEDRMVVADPFLLNWIRATHQPAIARKPIPPKVASIEEAELAFAQLSADEVAVMFALATEPTAALDAAYCEDHELDQGAAGKALTVLRAEGRLVDVDVDDRLVVRGPVLKKWVKEKARAARSEDVLLTDLVAEVQPQRLFLTLGRDDLAVLRALAHERTFELTQDYCELHGLEDPQACATRVARLRQDGLVRVNSGRYLVVASRDDRIWLRANTRTFAQPEVRVGDSAAAADVRRLRQEMRRRDPVQIDVLAKLAWEPPPSLEANLAEDLGKQPGDELVWRALGGLQIDRGLVGRLPDGSHGVLSAKVRALVQAEFPLQGAFGMTEQMTPRQEWALQLNRVYPSTEIAVLRAIAADPPTAFTPEYLQKWGLAQVHVDSVLRKLMGGAGYIQFDGRYVLADDALALAVGDLGARPGKARAAEVETIGEQQNWIDVIANSGAKASEKEIAR